MEISYKVFSLYKKAINVNNIKQLGFDQYIGNGDLWAKRKTYERQNLTSIVFRQTCPSEKIF